MTGGRTEGAGDEETGRTGSAGEEVPVASTGKRLGRRRLEVQRSPLVGFMSVPLHTRVPIRRSTLLMAVAFAGFATLMGFYPPASSVKATDTSSGSVLPGVIPAPVTTTTTTTTSLPPTTSTTTTTVRSSTTTSRPVSTTTTTVGTSVTTTTRAGSVGGGFPTTTVRGSPSP